MKILNAQAEIRDKNNLCMELMCEMVGVVGLEGVIVSLDQGLELLHDNLPARLFTQLGFQTYLVRTSQKGNPGEVYDKLRALLKEDQDTTIDEGQAGEKALRRAHIPFPLLALILGAGSVMGFTLHNKIQRIKESN